MHAAGDLLQAPLVPTLVPLLLLLDLCGDTWGLLGTYKEAEVPFKAYNCPENEDKPESDHISPEINPTSDWLHPGLGHGN